MSAPHKDDFGVGFEIYNVWLLFSLYLVIIQVIPIPRKVQKILAFPAYLRVKIGEDIKLQLAHLAIFFNVILVVVLYIMTQSLQNLEITEKTNIKNYSKKWEYETYIYQSCIALAWWLYTLSFGSLNDRKESLIEQIDKLKKSGKKESNKKEEEVKMEKEKTKEKFVKHETKKPKDD